MCNLFERNKVTIFLVLSHQKEHFMYMSVHTIFFYEAPVGWNKMGQIMKRNDFRFPLVDYTIIIILPLDAV
jgi:hypothetical protein